MRVFVIFLTFIINIALGSTLFKGLKIFGIGPDFMVLFIVSYAVLRGDIEGSIVGFFTGLFHDIFFSDLIGLSAMLGFLTGFVCGKPFRDFFRENDFLALILAGGGVLFFESSQYFFTYLFRGETDFIYYFNRKILPVTVYTVAFTIPVYRLFYLINSKLEAREKTRRKLF